MTKKQLLDLIAQYPDDADIMIDIHDTVLYEDLYDFTFEPVSWTRFHTDNTSEQMHELRLCPIEHTNE
jgi:hypothetical protein|tara:strand:+ start:25627 stop:25830 length:204 start_codon:yes stop_codon:yes gene_type:complete